MKKQINLFPEPSKEKMESWYIYIENNDLLICI